MWNPRNTVFALALVVGICTSVPALAQINTDVALTPPKGGSILRLQYSYSEADGRGAIAHVNASVVKATYIYGLKENFALFLTAPYVNRQVDKFAPQLGR
ncbi:MAG: hypothetical protein IH989_02855, partial [Planctomycetes bacterium]|nr:hypothetical protein [Planctomycetota bacterium]